MMPQMRSGTIVRINNVPTKNTAPARASMLAVLTDASAASAIRLAITSNVMLLGSRPNCASNFANVLSVATTLMDLKAKSYRDWAKFIVKSRCEWWLNIHCDAISVTSKVRSQVARPIGSLELVSDRWLLHLRW